MDVTQQSRRALGSQAQLTLVTRDQATASEILEELWERIDKFEAKFSRFLATSELSQVNAAAGTKVHVSAAFLRLLKTAINCHQLTEGLYNPLLLPQLQKAGYVGSWPTPDNYDASLDYRRREAANPTDIQIGDNWVALPANSALDFGGCGKGYLLDQLAGYLDTQPLDGYCLSLGGDIICAGSAPQQQPWQIPIESAADPTKDAATIDLSRFAKQALATSGTNKRKGADWNHLIDPRSGKPTLSTIASASVIDDSALMADIYAKCIIIIGEEAAESWASEHHVRGAVLQSVVAGAPQITKLGDL